MSEGLVVSVPYVVLIVLWSGLTMIYARHWRAARVRDPLVAALLAVMVLDAFKNFVESVYFGIVWSARYEMIPPAIGAPLESPWVMPLPKLLNIAVAVILVWRVAGRYIPNELREREQRRAHEAKLLAEQQTAMARVQESERRLQSLFDATTDLVSFWIPSPTAPGTMVLESLNPAARTFFSVGDDVLGRPARPLLGDGFGRLLDEALQTKKPVRRDAAPITTPSGERMINTQVVPVLDDSGAVVRVAALAHDITELTKKAREEEQRTRLESLGLLAGGVAHDFNNLLAVVKADVDLARSGNRADRALAHAGDAIARARELVEQLMSTAGARARQSESVDVGAVVADTVRLLSPSSGKVRLKSSSAPGAWVTGDRAQLQQIVLNLVQNAIEAVNGNGNGSDNGNGNGHAGVVEARVDATEGKVVVTVADDGPGIPVEVQARMFDPFFTTKKDGRGLGLSTVFGLAQAHGGRVEVGSEPGKGARFTITLPRTASPPRASTPPSMVAPTVPPWDYTPSHGSSRVAALSPVSQPPWSPTPSPSVPDASAVRGEALRVLLIDDDDLVRRASRRLLERLGHTVVDVSSGIDALQVTTDYDVAVVDVTMPDLDGPATLHRLRERRPDLPAVIITGRGDVVVDDDVVLAKPFDADGLRGALVRAFSKRAG